MGLLKNKEDRAAVKARWANLGDFTGEGVVIEHDITEALPVDTLVRSITDGELYVSIDSTTPAYAKLTGPTSAPSGAIIVAKTGGDYTTIAAGLAAASSGDTVIVYPGTYAENITIPAGVNLFGFGNPESIIISGADTTSTRVVLNDTCELANLTVIGPSTGSAIAVDATGLIATEIALIEHVNFQGNGGSGPLFDGPGAGEVTIVDCRHYGGNVNGSAFRFSGGGEILLRGFGLVIGSSTTAIEVQDADINAQEIIFSPTAYTTTNGIYLTNASAKLQVSSLMFSDFGALSVTNALRIGADGCRISVTAAHLHATTYGLLVDPALTGAGTEISILGELRFEEISVPSGWFTTAEVFGVIVDDGVKNDPGVRALEMTVGVMDAPAELSVGTGDSVVPLSVWTYDSSLTSWTDVTVAAQSRTGSTFTMPSDLGDKLYLGFDRPFTNVKALMTQIAIPGSGSLREAIWTGAGYETIRTMSTDADEPHQQHGDVSFAFTLNEHLRLDIEGDSDPTSGTFGEPYSNWATEDPMSAGTAYYYLVFEVVDANLTQAPIFQRLKVGLSRLEINATGFPETFGAGEGERKHIGNSGRRTFGGGGTPGPATFALSPNVTIDVDNAVFSNNSTEGFVVEHIVPRGVDTSREFEFEVEWTVDGTITGDVELEIIASAIEDGDNIDAGTLTEVSRAVVTTVTASNYNGVLNKTSFWFAFPDAISGSIISVAVLRDATAGNLDDTLAGSIKIWDTDLKAVRWTPN